MRGIYCGALLGLALSVSAVADDLNSCFGFRLLEIDEQHPVRWQIPEGGIPPSVTYAFLESPMAFDGARNCGRMLPSDEALKLSDLSDATFRREVRAAFRMWMKAANIRFREVEDPNEAGIVIGAQAEPQGRAFTNVTLKAGTTGTARTISQSLICLNPAVKWKASFNGDLGTFDVRYTMAHEIGHAIGLDHPSAAGQLMSYRYDERQRKLQLGDMAGAIALYGKRRRSEPGAGRELSVGTAASMSLRSSVEAREAQGSGTPFGIGEARQPEASNQR